MEIGKLLALNILGEDELHATPLLSGSLSAFFRRTVGEQFQSKAAENLGEMATCAVKGGCPSDYVAISISILSIVLLLAKAIKPYLVHNIPRPQGRSFWLIALQLFASFNLILSTVEAVATHSIIFISSTVIHVEKPLNNRCHMGTLWIIPIMCLHASYVAAMVGFTGAIRHIEFRFQELKDLWRGILVSTCCIALWVVCYILNEAYEDIELLQIISRFLLLFMTSLLVLSFFSISISQPLVTLTSLRERDHPPSAMMGRALGVLPDSGLLVEWESTQLVNPNEPLDKLLLNRRFRRSFMEFADSCLAGESVHFYEEVQQLHKIPTADHVRRIYMARHIIDNYITPGATMEVNISHRCRQEILSTLDLAHPNLFKNSLNELIQLMKMNLANDYWSSTFYMKLKEEARMRKVERELEHSGWNFSHRLSSVHCADDPFHHEHSPRKLGSSSRDLGLLQ
ncbi:regulator of G-protein signaling 1 [Phtheirospermum japonicum]|uniref:Regulator of G-protein signaling 1 n=1 Tax=Phtheirospermum japonicum TaxID=374723 RepID=A0A830BQL2_9LAMI|nr:regulator of G-protein signaling 1 [Phtheirospermum japonicum]